VDVTACNCDVAGADQDLEVTNGTTTSRFSTGAAGLSNPVSSSITITANDGTGAVPLALDDTVDGVSTGGGTDDIFSIVIDNEEVEFDLSAVGFDTTAGTPTVEELLNALNAASGVGVDTANTGFTLSARLAASGSIVISAQRDGADAAIDNVTYAAGTSTNGDPYVQQFDFIDNSPLTPVTLDAGVNANTVALQPLGVSTGVTTGASPTTTNTYDDVNDRRLEFEQLISGTDGDVSTVTTVFDALG